MTEERTTVSMKDTAFLYTMTVGCTRNNMYIDLYRKTTKTV